ncbi:MAG: hypothetical protein MUO84_04680 [Thermoplasmata archaeon]|nr:hypothetical protein [Thermoplasmata archaeon]
MTKHVTSDGFCDSLDCHRHVMNMDQVMMRLLLHLGAGLQVGRSGL